MQSTITFIGAGNMASSLMSGLIANHYSADKIWATNPSPDKLTNLREKLGIHTSQNNSEGAEHADILVFAVKPHILKTVILELQQIIAARKPLLISVATGIRETHIRQWLAFDVPIVRCMPNTPAIVGYGATGLYANRFTDQNQRELAESILRAVGITLWVDAEEQIDTVTALSGSGPAYFFLIMEALEEAAVKLGLPQDTAKLLTIQTALGSARLALESNQEPASLRKKVTSQGGATEAALRVLTDANIKNTFAKAITAAKTRANELADLGTYKK